MKWTMHLHNAVLLIEMQDSSYEGSRSIGAYRGDLAICKTIDLPKDFTHIADLTIVEIVSGLKGPKWNQIGAGIRLLQTKGLLT